MQWMIQLPARALNIDVGYDTQRGQFSYRTPQGIMLTVHPAVADAVQTVPAYAPDGSIIVPLQPPDDSGFVLAPEANGGWCYLNPATGRTQWHAPAGSGPLQTRTLALAPEPFPHVPPSLSDSLTVTSPLLVSNAMWEPIFHDRQHYILFRNLQTGAMREAPWISLRTADGLIYFANLITRETRWFPPHLWMAGWVARSTVIRPDSFRQNEAFSSCRPDALSSATQVLDPYIARLCVEGGAPYKAVYMSAAPRSMDPTCTTRATHTLTSPTKTGTMSR